jgi:hypothetical protein
MNDELTRRAIVLTFCAVMAAVFFTLLLGLFFDTVDNAKIFEILTHSFDMILVALTGFLGGRASKSKDD